MCVFVVGGGRGEGWKDSVGVWARGGMKGGVSTAGTKFLNTFWSSFTFFSFMVPAGC